MLVIVAAQHDSLAQKLVARWQSYGAGLLTCTDLSTRGWHQELHTSSRSTAVISGQVVATQSITGVLTRMSCVFEQELIDIVREDRSYVTSEMNAFLLAFLSSLQCPVLNEPTPTCLSGPYLRQEQWLRMAASVGIPVRQVQHSSNGSEPVDVDSFPVTVVGSHCFGTVDSTLATQARRLADAAHVDLLSVHFSGTQAGARFVKADLWPDPTSGGVQDALLAYLQEEYKYHREWRR